MPDDKTPIPYPPQAPNRIDPVTPANAETNTRLAPINTLTPGAGGWTPQMTLNLVLTLIIGAVSTVGALLAGGGVITVGAIVGAALTGLGAGLATFFGVKSAGTRKLE